MKFFIRQYRNNSLLERIPFKLYCIGCIALISAIPFVWYFFIYAPLIQWTHWYETQNVYLEKTVNQITLKKQEGGDGYFQDLHHTHVSERIKKILARTYEHHLHMDKFERLGTINKKEYRVARCVFALQGQFIDILKWIEYCTTSFTSKIRTYQLSLAQPTGNTIRLECTLDILFFDRGVMT